MTILPAPLEYTDKDFESLNRRLEHLLKSGFTEWTDFSRPSWGNVLKELFCHATDVLTFYQDEQAGEARWGTARLRKNIISSARLISYKLAGATAATVDVTFSILRPTPGDLPIPKGTGIRTLGGGDVVRFQTLTDTVIRAGQASSEPTPAEHSRSQLESFEASGEPDYELRLSGRPYLDQSLELEIDGQMWQQVDHFLDSTSADHHYVLFVDENDRATLRLGDGTNGALPISGALIRASYKTGGGPEGNLEPHALKRVEGGPWTDSFGNSVSLLVDNPNGAKGGLERETVAQARFRAPRSLRVLTRAVSRQDYEDLAMQHKGVARALMLGHYQDPVVEQGRGWLYIVPTGGGQPSSALLGQVKAWLDRAYPSPMTFDWETRAPIYHPIDIEAWLYLAPGAKELEVEASALLALRRFFSPLDADGLPNFDINFGYYYKNSLGEPDPKVAFSTIYNFIHDVPGLRRLGTPADNEGLLLNGLQDDVDLVVREFPCGGRLSLWNGDTKTLFSGHPVVI